MHFPCIEDTRYTRAIWAPRVVDSTGMSAWLSLTVLAAAQGAHVARVLTNVCKSRRQHDTFHNTSAATFGNRARAWKCESGQAAPETWKLARNADVRRFKQY